ncbi:SPW repeat protein [Amycolatopsis sp. NPDC098790]|uniref:SPW repeat domain-containing protein n=1 Tax=Amycolatopsis sp. NPDC098790 TaxID=3363939 RepID=UPI003813A561
MTGDADPVDVGDGGLPGPVFGRGSFVEAEGDGASWAVDDDAVGALPEVEVEVFVDLVAAECGAQLSERGPCVDAADLGGELRSGSAGSDGQHTSVRVDAVGQRLTGLLVADARGVGGLVEVAVVGVAAGTQVRCCGGEVQVADPVEADRAAAVALDGCVGFLLLDPADLLGEGAGQRVEDARLIAPRAAGWLELVNVGLGLWLIVSPFALGYPSEGYRDAAKTNAMVVGILVAIFSVVAVTVVARRRVAAHGRV